MINNIEPITVLLSCIVLLGFTVPEPPGILGVLLEYYVFGGKQREEAEARKWRRINEIEEELKKEGKTLHDEIRLAQKGESKYFKRL